MNTRKLLNEGWVQVYDGATITPRVGDRFFAVSGSINISQQSGGEVRLYNEAVASIKNQSGGECSLRGKSSVFSTNMYEGQINGHGKSMIHSVSQNGGVVAAHDESEVTSHGQKGGSCLGLGAVKIQSFRKKGGEVIDARDGADIMVIDEFDSLSNKREDFSRQLFSMCRATD